MKSITNRLNVAIFLVLAAAALSVVFYQQASANPSSILEKKSANAATSTLAYLGAGTATSTLYADLQSDNAPADTANLLIAFTASSTASQLKWRYEYSQGVSGVDCTATPTLCDWYSESVNNAASSATTTVEVRDFKEYSWQFASSSPGGAPTQAATSTGYKSIVVPTPTRYVRVVFYMLPGATNGAVWSDLVYKRENR